MSTNAYVKFYSIDGSFIKEVCLDKLKWLMTSWTIEDMVTPNYDIDFHEARKAYSREYLGKISNTYEINTEDVLSISNELTLKKGVDISKFDDALLTEDSQNTIDVYYYKEYDLRGNFFDTNSFVNARNKLEAERKEFYQDLYKLKALRDSVDYYKLTVEQKEDLDNDINYNDDMAQERDNQIYICQYMIDLLEDGVKDLLSLDWKKKVVAFIYFA